MADTLHAAAVAVRSAPAMTASKRAIAAMPDDEPADVCIIVEGAYPYVSGGLSTWIDNLIRRHSSLTFTVVAILPNSPPPEPRYACPPNRKALGMIGSRP